MGGGSFLEDSYPCNRALSDYPCNRALSDRSPGSSLPADCPRGPAGAVQQRNPAGARFSRTELAQLLGASRPKVTGALRLLAESSAIRRTMDCLFFDPAKLARIADGELPGKAGVRGGRADISRKHRSSAGRKPTDPSAAHVREGAPMAPEGWEPPGRSRMNDGGNPNLG
jgi:hypothetical protein